MQLTFYIARKISQGETNAEEEAAAMGIDMPDNLHLMIVIASGMSRGRLYTAGSEVAYLKIESSWAPSSRKLAPIKSCSY